VQAQVCGDADGSGTTTVSDGVAVLRAAAQLDSACTTRTCDVDGNGTITVSDGVTTLRRVAQLPADVSCGTRFGSLLKTVAAGGVPADLQIEVFVNGASQGTYPNTPASAVHVVETTVESASLTYRFECRSGNAVSHLHPLVHTGMASLGE
jgi:hypothetical protein